MVDLKQKILDATGDGLDIIVSFFASFFDNEPISRPLKDVVNLAMSDSIKNMTLEIRRLRAIAKDENVPIDQALVAKDKADKLKKQLPSFLTDVYCEHGKKRNHIVRFLPFLGFDADHMTEAEVVALMEQLNANPHVVIAEPSCSRTGVHFMIRMDVADWLNAQWDGKNIKPYEYVWRQAKEYVESTFNIAIDVNCMNPEHIFGICFDEMVHYKENPVPLHIDTSAYVEPTARVANTQKHNPQKSISSSETHLMVHSQQPEDLMSEVRELTDIIVSRGIDITEGYDNWLKLGFALAEGLGEDGRGFYHDLSSMYPDYNTTECDKQYDACLRGHGQGITIKTFFQMAKDAGIDLSQFARENMQRNEDCSNAQLAVTSATVASADSVEAKPELDPALIEKLENCVVDMDADYPENKFLFAVDDVPFLTIGDIHTLGAKQKAGKTSLVSIFLSAVICGKWNRVSCSIPNVRVLYVDTEMKKGDTKQLGMKAAAMAGVESLPENINLVNFRPLMPDEMEKGIRYFIAMYKPQFVIIDGIVDLCSNFNDVEASQDLVFNFLMKIAEEHRCAILSVLHTNKTDGYTELRGHLGAFLGQKGDTVIKTEKDEATNIVTVKFPTHRYAPVPEFHFGFSEDGMPICADAQYDEIEANKQQADKEKKEANKQKVFEDRSNTIVSIIRYNGGQMERATLIEEAKEALKKGDSTIKGLLKTMLDQQNSLIVQEDKIIRLS